MYTIDETVKLERCYIEIWIKLFRFLVFLTTFSLLVLRFSHDWCVKSARSPVQVFTLLETLYGAFDKIASRRRVFKVETIGDCYVAATGLVRS
jgi:Adenylate and Guanylate cyclase catalytic domain